jgi:hypothetical protein
VGSEKCEVGKQKQELFDRIDKVGEMRGFSYFP